MRLFAISDIHIQSSDDVFLHTLIDLILNKTKRGDIFVFAGDIFDLYVGNKKIFFDRYIQFFKALEKASHQGVQFHYIEGNHDFQMQSVFKNNSNVFYHSDFVHLEILEKKFFIAHGDLVNRKDYKYLILRTFLRSLFMRVFIYLAPGDLIEKIGSLSSKKSRASNYMIPSSEKIKSLRKIYRNFSAEKISENYHYVILGHCHDSDEMTFKIENHLGKYMNIGYPKFHNHYLLWDSEKNSLTREKFNNGTTLF